MKTVTVGQRVHITTTGQYPTRIEGTVLADLGGGRASVGWDDGPTTEIRIELLAPIGEVPRRVIILDVESGQWLPGSSGIQGDDGARLAATLLPGMPADQLARIYGAWMDNDGAAAAAEVAAAANRVEAFVREYGTGSQYNTEAVTAIGRISGEYRLTTADLLTLIAAARGML